MIYYNYPPYYYLNPGYKSPKKQKSVPETPTQLKTQPKFKKKNSSNNGTIFELFGIKLYSDDILLICLIFFLYNEGVKDDYLFIALILLLLS